MNKFRDQINIAFFKGFCRDHGVYSGPRFVLGIHIYLSKRDSTTYIYMKMDYKMSMGIKMHVISSPGREFGFFLTAASVSRGSYFL